MFMLSTGGEIEKKHEIEFDDTSTPMKLASLQPGLVQLNCLLQLACMQRKRP